MKFFGRRFGFLSLLLLLLIGCSSKQEDTPIPPANYIAPSSGEAALTDASVLRRRSLRAPRVCENPFEEPDAESLILPAQLVRGEGSWVLTNQRSFAQTRYGAIDPASLSGLSSNSIEMIREEMAKPNSLDLGVDFSVVSWRHPGPGREVVSIYCSSESRTRKASALGLQNLKNAAAFSINAETLVTKFIANTLFKSNGLHASFMTDYLRDLSGSSLLYTNWSQVAKDTRVQFVRISNSAFYLRTIQVKSSFRLLKIADGDVNIGSAVETHDVSIPTSDVIIVQNRYELK